MAFLNKPFHHLNEVTDAAAKIVSLQADLFLLKQEIKTLRQIKRAMWLGGSLLAVNLMLILTLYWLEMTLYEMGWSSLALALLSFLALGAIALGCGAVVYFMGRQGEE